jgi:hypothetical protein
MLSDIGKRISGERYEISHYQLKKRCLNSNDEAYCWSERVYHTYWKEEQVEENIEELLSGKIDIFEFYAEVSKKLPYGEKPRIDGKIWGD